MPTAPGKPIVDGHSICVGPDVPPSVGWWTAEPQVQRRAPGAAERVAGRTRQATTGRLARRGDGGLLP